MAGDHCGTSGTSPDAPQARRPCNTSEDRHAHRNERINERAHSDSGSKNYGFPGHRRSAPISRNFPDVQQHLLSCARVVPVKERSGEQKSLEHSSVYLCESLSASHLIGAKSKHLSHQRIPRHTRKGHVQPRLVFRLRSLPLPPALLRSKSDLLPTSYPATRNTKPLHVRIKPYFICNYV